MLLLPAAGSGAGTTNGDSGRFLLQTSVWTTHYSSNPEHHERQDLINLEYQAPESYRFDWQEELDRGGWTGWLADVDWVVGGAAFKNSYNQQTFYVYGGGQYDFYEGEHTRVYGKLTAGLIHGYRGEHRDRIPFNRHGVAPAIVPGLGIQYRRVGVEVIPFGNAGVMIGAGVYF